MKKYIYSVLVLFSFCACSSEMDEVSLPAPVQEAAIVVSQKTTSVVNVISFTTNVTDLGNYVWDFGNGEKAVGATVSAAYPFKGEYKGTLTLVTKGGMTVKGFDVSIKSDNYELVKDPIYTILSGGVEAENGKTWVIDSTTMGHLGVGPENTETAEWWNAVKVEKVGLGLYDDELTFILNGAKFVMNNHGTTFVNGGAKDLMKARGGTFPDMEGDVKANYTPADNWTWSIKKEGTKNYITFLDGQGFMAYLTPGPYRYEILSISKDEMHVRQQIAGLSWYIKFIRKGFVKE